MSQSRFEAELLQDGAVFAESPRWHGGSFWYSDIGAGEIRRLWPDGRSEVFLAGLETPSGLGWLPDGDLVVACIRPSTVYRVGPDGAASVWFGPDDHGTLALNDMATSGTQSYVTCVGRHHEPGSDGSALREPVGSILLLDHAQRRCSKVAAGLRLPNGVVITPDGRSLIVSEMGAQRILSFPIEPSGMLGSPQEWAATPCSGDGICLDAEGGVWVGSTEDYFLRLGPDGTETARIEIPGWACVAPMLGGADGRTLLMAAYQMDDIDAMFSGGSRSRLFTARVEIPAAGF